jgi:hypothetical protein
MSETGQTADKVQVEDARQRPAGSPAFDRAENGVLRFYGAFAPQWAGSLSFSAFGATV